MEENIITLIDEDGKEVEFEVCLTLEAEGKEYAILLPLDEESYGDDEDVALVFRIDSDENGDILVPLEDEEEYQIVVDVYNTLMDEEGFTAVYVGTGAGLPHFMHIDGENLNGVYSANEFLTRVNLMRAYQFPNVATPVYVGKNVAVVGAGNVAMDAARTAKRLGAEQVYIVYRRSEDEMPARKEEIGHAKEDGIELRLLNNPTRILGNDKGWVNGMECIKMELGEPDASGRRSPVEIKGSEYVLDVDMVVMAIGQGPNPLLKQTTPELETNKRGNIVANEEGATSIPGVFAGGDIVTGAATVISAMGAGKKAALAIDEYLSKH